MKVQSGVTARGELWHCKDLNQLLGQQRRETPPERDHSPDGLHVLEIFRLWAWLEAQRNRYLREADPLSLFLIIVSMGALDPLMGGKKNMYQLHHSKILICQIIVSKTVFTLHCRIFLHFFGDCSRHSPSWVVSISHPQCFLQPPRAFPSLFSALD